MKTQLFIKARKFRYQIPFKIIFLALSIFLSSFYFESTNAGVFLGLAGSFNVDYGGLNHILPIDRNQKFVSGLIESSAIVGVASILSALYAGQTGLSIAGSKFGFFVLFHFFIYNLVVTLPPARTLQSGWKIIMCCVEVISVLLILILKMSPTSQYQALTVWFLTFYSLHFLCYSKWGHERKGVFL